MLKASRVILLFLLMILEGCAFTTATPQPLMTPQSGSTPTRVASPTAPLNVPTSTPSPTTPVPSATAPTTIAIPSPAPSDSPRVRQQLDELRQLQSARSTPIVERIQFWDQGTLLQWNAIARRLVAKYNTNPPLASRMFALLSVAQHEALVATWAAHAKHARRSPAELDPTIKPVPLSTGHTTYPSDVAAISSASATVLAQLFPAEQVVLTQSLKEAMDTRIWAGANLREDVDAGEWLGRQIGERTIAESKSDGAAQAGAQLPLPKGPGMWYVQPYETKPPVLPKWGQVRTWLLKNGSALRPEPPPAFDSPTFKAALAEVRQFSDTRTAEQLRIALFWADGPTTPTPPGHWNQIAGDLIAKNKMEERRASQIMFLLNITMMDAGIACWDAKYHYWLLRPSQADPQISTPVGVPNFPSYTSGHSTFSGAAAEVLAYFFPAEQESLRKMASEASMSRLYGGIHYRFDAEVGIRMGREIGLLAIQRAKIEGW